jgi:hypothetical protein
LKEECDDLYGRNLDAEQRDDGLKRMQEDIAETEKKLIELEQEIRKDLAEMNKKLQYLPLMKQILFQSVFTLDETHINQYLPLINKILISIYPDETHVNQYSPLMKHIIILISFYP